MKIYVLYVDGEPFHSFVAADDKIAVATARRMINSTAYTYKSDNEILSSFGLKPNKPPKIFESCDVIDLVSLDPLFDSANKVEVEFIQDKLLDEEVLDELFFECLPVDLRNGETDRLAHAVSEVTDNG